MNHGSPVEALDLMLASLSNNTMKQYSTSFKSWWLFCSLNGINPYQGSNQDVLRFLLDQFNNKHVSYGTLNCHRSALSLLLNENHIGSYAFIKRLLKGAYKLKPSSPRYSSTWDPQLVLNLVATWIPNQDISLDKLVKKVVILIALCTAHRVQTLSLIKTENIHFGSSGVKIIIADPIKTSGPGREQPVLFLPYFKEDINICPATALQAYLLRTQDTRGEISNLFLTSKRPIRKATSQTISRWIKAVLSESGIDVSRFKAHSTRHASTSMASVVGVGIDAIRKAAGWSASSCTFAKFYNRPIVDESQFAKSVCLKTTSRNETE